MTFDDEEKNFTADGLFAITFDGMQQDKLQLRENVMLQNALGEISEDLQSRKPFDTSKPCAICGKVGHTFQNCGMIKSNKGQTKLIRLFLAAKRFNNINRRIFESDLEAPLNAMQTFPLSQIIEMEQHVGDTSLQQIHSVQQTFPTTASSNPPRSSSLHTMSVVAQHASQIHDLERRLQSQDALINQLLGSNTSNNDSSSDTSLNSITSDNTSVLNNFLGAGS